MLQNSQFSTENMLAVLCGSETRVRLVRALFERPTEPQNLASLARAASSDPANTLRVLRKLVQSNLLEVVESKSVRGYRPRRDTPVFHHLHALFSPDNFTYSSSSSHSKLDEHKRQIGKLIIERHALNEIREKSIANLKRWRANGVWNEAYEDWMGILEYGSNAHLIKVMTSLDDESNRLRQSMPYVGLLDRDTIRELNEKVAA